MIWTGIFLVYSSNSNLLVIGWCADFDRAKERSTLFSSLSKFAREPLLHFLIAGAIIYGIYYAVAVDGADNTDAKQIIVSSQESGRLRADWKKRWNRDITKAEFDGLMKQIVREKILYREAVKLGLDQNDPVTERRLAQKIEILSKDLAKPKDPTDEELRAYMGKHVSRYEIPAKLTISHLFFDPDKRGDSTPADAKAQLEILQRNGTKPDVLSEVGDRFLLQSYYPQRTYDELDKLFARGFSDQFKDAEPEKWTGPVLSGYGVHLIYLHSRQEKQPPAFEAIRSTLEADWKEQKVNEFSEAFIGKMMAQYEVTIEEQSEGGSADNNPVVSQ
jgi:peptidyl-prolyl cis-trans isomerase C